MSQMMPGNTSSYIPKHQFHGTINLKDIENSNHLQCIHDVLLVSKTSLK